MFVKFLQSSRKIARITKMLILLKKIRQNEFD